MKCSSLSIYTREIILTEKKIVMMRGEISGYKDLCTTKENTEKIIFYVNVYY